MSEKRFQKGDNLSCIDTETGKSYWYACNLCGLLNEQQAIIEEQNKEIEESSAFIIEQRKENKRVKEENEQLRKELDNFKPVMFQDVRKGNVILYSKGV